MKTVSLKDSGKALEKQIKEIKKDVSSAAARALNSSARKSRTAVANLEAKTLGFKSKRFKKAIHVEKATRDNLEAKVIFPDEASEVSHDGKTFLMIPIKGYLKKVGIPKASIKKGMANDLLQYSRKNPKKKKGRVKDPQAFFPVYSAKTDQYFITARQKENRKKQNWLYVGRVGKNPDFEAIVNKTVSEHLEEDFERELKKIMEKKNK